MVEGRRPQICNLGHLFLIICKVGSLQHILVLIYDQLRKTLLCLKFIAAVKLQKSFSGLSIFLHLTLHIQCVLCQPSDTVFSYPVVPICFYNSTNKIIIIKMYFRYIFLFSHCKPIIYLSHHSRCTGEGSVQAPLIPHPRQMLHLNQKCLICEINEFFIFLKPSSWASQTYLTLSSTSNISSEIFM